MEDRTPYITGGSKMREHKYRAWDKFTKKMVMEGFNVIGEVTCFNCLEQYGDAHPNPIYETSIARLNDFILMQFTGLEGCYGGDIVKITGEGYYSNDSFTVDEEEWEFIGKVEFNSFMWLVVQEDGTWFSFADMAEGDFGFEIIGNKYENKNLLDSN